MSGALAARLLVGNLDCESDFAAAAGRRRVAAGRRALETAAAAATLLRAFASDGDRLWLPAEVPPERVADVGGLPRPALESGPLERLQPAGEILAWGETEAVARLRRGTSREPPAARGQALHHLPWFLVPASAAAAGAVNSRFFCLRLAAELGCNLPGARRISSLEQLERHLASGGARASGGAWVAKAPFSAAGRWRVVHRGELEADVRRRVEELIERQGPLVFEPWMERAADFGCAAAVTAEGTVRLSLHRQLLDSRGRFVGVELVAGGRGFSGPWLDDAERSSLERVVEGVARALACAGYTGPFGVDAWRYRRSDGRQAFHPLGEINARMTFGLVARALVDRLREPLGLDPQERVRLVVGRLSATAVGATVELFRAEGVGGRRIRLEIGSTRIGSAP